MDVTRWFTHSFILMNHETSSIKHSRSQRMQPFSISIAALHSISNLWFVWSKHTHCPSDSTIFLFFLSFPYCWSGGCWRECNFWYASEVAGEFGPAAPRLCSTLRWLHFPLAHSPYGYIRWMNMPGTRGERLHFHTKMMVASFLFSFLSFFSSFCSAETLIISKTANTGDVFIQAPCAYLSSGLYRQPFKMKLLWWMMGKPFEGEDAEE